MITVYFSYPDNNQSLMAQPCYRLFELPSVLNGVIESEPGLINGHLFWPLATAKGNEALVRD